MLWHYCSDAQQFFVKAPLPMHLKKNQKQFLSLAELQCQETIGKSFQSGKKSRSSWNNFCTPHHHPLLWDCNKNEITIIIRNTHFCLFWCIINEDPYFRQGVEIIKSRIQTIRLSSQALRERIFSNRKFASQFIWLSSFISLVFELQSSEHFNLTHYFKSS